MEIASARRELKRFEGRCFIHPLLTQAFFSRIDMARTGMRLPTVRVLITDDVVNDAELEVRELKRGGLRVAHRVVDSEASFTAALRKFAPDVILSDFTMIGFDGMLALSIAREVVPHTPFVFVSGTIGEEYAIRALKSGATDYVLKTNLMRLPAAVERALAEASARRERLGMETALEVAQDRLREREAALTRAQLMAKLAHVVTRSDGTFESWSETLPQLIGMDSARMPRSTREWLGFVYPDDRAGLQKMLEDTGATGARLDLEYRLRRPDGTWVSVRHAIEPTPGAPDAQGGARFFSTLQDITEEKRAEQRIKRLNRVHAVLSGINSLIVRVRDRDELFREACRIAVELGKLRLVYIALVNAEAQRIRPIAWAGDDPEFGRLDRPLWTPGTARPEGGASRAVRTKVPVIQNDIQPHSSDMTYAEEALKRGYRSAASLPLVVGDKAVGVIGLLAGELGYFDAEEMKLLQELAGDIAFALENIEKAEKVRRLTRVQAVLSGINAAIVRIRDRQELFGESCRIAVEAGQFPLAWIGVVDRTDHRVKAAAWAGDERGFVQLGRPTVGAIGVGKAGLSAQAIDTRRPAICNDIEADGSAMRYAKEALERGYRSAAALPLAVDGTAIGALVLYAGEAGFFDDDEIKLLLELAGDISFALGHLQKAEKLNYLAYYDELTGLANGMLFHERLEQHAQAAGAANRKLAVFIVNVDRFKSINDAFGRQASDELLKQIAGRFARAGSGDASRLARVGADQFAGVVLEIESEEHFARLTELRLKECFGPPYRIGEQELRISAKVGIAVFPHDGTDAAALFRNAEAALKKAKATGERYVFYAQEMTERVAEKLSLENKLRQALEKNEFVLHYQPKVDLETRRIVGVEALIRWQSPELGLVPPMDFIPLLEETGLILEVGSWALKRAAMDQRAWIEMKLDAPRVAVNVSPIQLRQRDFVGVVEQAIIDGIAPTGIDLEITESLIMEDIEATTEKLKDARALGMNIAIDDFGTGYSSLAYLAKLPVASLKIDRSFIITMLNDPNTATLVSTIISLAHSLKLKVVAEGVDSEEQANVLRLLRCDEMQGYLFSKPLPMMEFSALLRKAG